MELLHGNETSFPICSSHPLSHVVRLQSCPLPVVRLGYHAHHTNWQSSLANPTSFFPFFQHPVLPSCFASQIREVEYSYYDQANYTSGGTPLKGRVRGQTPGVIHHGWHDVFRPIKWSLRIGSWWSLIFNHCSAPSALKYLSSETMAIFCIFLGHCVLGQIGLELELLPAEPPPVSTHIVQLPLQLHSKGPATKQDTFIFRDKQCCQLGSFKPA